MKVRSNIPIIKPPFLAPEFLIALFIIISSLKNFSFLLINLINIFINIPETYVDNKKIIIGSFAGDFSIEIPINVNAIESLSLAPQAKAIFITYLDENGNFGALGHGINDVDTSTLMNLQYGGIYTTDIIGIEKGEEGKPGELTGIISFDDEKQLGDVLRNTKGGIFGRISQTEIGTLNLTSAEVGLKQEIQMGPAQILCKMGEESKLYKIQITKINYESKEDNRGIVLQITDEELLDETGGIVQGMSGSPILQNGKIVGAVTHVFVNDPTKGYGIFIENMLEH